MLTAATQITADNWPGYAACCGLVWAAGAGVWHLIRRNR